VKKNPWWLVKLGAVRFDRLQTELLQPDRQVLECQTDRQLTRRSTMQAVHDLNYCFKNKDSEKKIFFRSCIACVTIGQIIVRGGN
jgi:hypothetical protein